MIIQEKMNVNVRKILSETGCRGSLLNCPCALLFGDPVYDSLHFPLAAGIVGPVQNFLLLCFGHGRISRHRRLIHGQLHTKANGYFVKVHADSPLQIFIWRRVAADTSSRAASNIQQPLGPSTSGAVHMIAETIDFHCHCKAEGRGKLRAGSAKFAEMQQKTGDFTGSVQPSRGFSVCKKARAFHPCLLTLIHRVQHILNKISFPPRIMLTVSI